MMESQTVIALREAMSTRFGVAPADVRFVFSPYRICPLGAHIDHQLGPVTALALDRGVHLAYAPAKAREVHLYSLDFPGEVHFALDAIPDATPGDWGNFARGAARALQQIHRLERGLVGLTAGSVSEGGLSSSAAIGVAYLLALEDVNELAVSVEENILLDQAIENGYLGLRNGILDQSAILLSRRDHLTWVDCATLRYERIARPPAMPDFVILIAFSGLQKALVGTDYNRRVAECTEAAAALLAAAGRATRPASDSSGPPRPPLLGDIAPADYRAHKHLLSGAPARRAAHFFSEVERVAQGVAAWRSGDLETFGRLITQSGESSIVNYECGAPPLIDLYRILIENPGVYGARFSGAGFRGCCLALVKPEHAEDAAVSVRQRYLSKYPEFRSRAQVFLCRPDDGARIVRP
ncbi:MAG: hypothetical protein N3D11_09840 [Candidatus Sumerlaeia bacterium]|nr:hypothetical protein [Candidatus Sumerlaeia bacterium]